jgi:hypothetical protein
VNPATTVASTCMVQLTWDALQGETASKCTMIVRLLLHMLHHSVELGDKLGAINVAVKLGLWPS